MTVLLATSLKMYFDHEETIAWAREVGRIAASSPIVRNGEVELTLFPAFPSLAEVKEIFADSPVTIGAQNMAAQARGAFTGEVGAPSLVQLGCTYVELAHAERRRLFHESLTDIQNKVRTAYDNGLVPLICTGEQTRTTSQEAAAECISFLADALDATPVDARGDVVVAYEPVWAIGTAQPAASSHVREVTTLLRVWVAHNFRSGRIIYGGSAGPGLYSSLHGAVDGLFLGRFAHDPGAIASLLDEVKGSLTALA